MRPLLLLSVLLLAGCTFLHRTPVAKPAAFLGGTASVQTSTTAAQTATDTAKTADAERLAKLRANVDAAATAPHIEQAPVAVNELTVAQGRLSDVKPDPVEQAAAAERRMLVEQGRADEARQNAMAAAKDGEAKAAELVQLKAKAEQLARERDKAVADFAAQADANRIANQKAIDSALKAQKDAEDRQHNAMLHEQASKLTWIGISCISAAIAISALVGFFGSLIVLRKLGIYLIALAGIGFLFLGAAQIISQWWFMWACVIAIIGILVAVGAWAWRHQKRGDLAQEMQARTTKVAAVATTVVPILDSAYEQAEGSVKDWLDTHLFRRLSSAMDRSTKATVHEIRATSATPANTES